MDPEIRMDAEEDFLNAMMDAALEHVPDFEPTDDELDAMEQEHFGDYNYEEGDENS
jgi:hypothetical protein